MLFDEPQATWLTQYVVLPSDPFVLEPEDRQSGWVGRLRGVGGNSGFHITGELGAEEREDRVGISARASLVLGL